MIEPANRVLLVDDDDVLRRAYHRLLTGAGWAVETAENGREAIAKLGSGFDVIVSDVAMPEIDGVDMLRIVREHELDVPVVLVSGEPQLEAAVRAVEYGAFRFLVKPVERERLLETLAHAVRMSRLAKLRREAFDLTGEGARKTSDRSALHMRFDQALATLEMAYQPIVSLREERVYAYEALLRCQDPALRNPTDVLELAERTGRIHELGRAIRARVAAQAALVPAGVKLFINLHPVDLDDAELYSEDSALSRIAPRVVLEITERASLDHVKGIASCVRRLRRLGYLIAIDDLGAGYSGLSSFTQLDPSVVKLDVSLVRGIETDARQRTIVGSMKRMCDELQTIVIAEGVETAAECDALLALGCDLLQGYLFGKPEQWALEMTAQSPKSPMGEPSLA
jgi:EAL domain-containing protein (putative c-di-GMP-specific phosphodiesterase class I)